jgi:glyoxylase-like metal-dependent hydrolase (beta-lactamase superfamily II)
VRRLARAALALLALAALAAAGALALAHREIRARDPALPGDAEVLALAAVPGGPVALAWHETARQPMPRALVLEPAADPDGAAPYVMSHPSFALAFSDGRLLLVDLGMDGEGARAFGRPLEWAGAAPLVFASGAAQALGPAVARVGGALFSHLHADHVGGVVALCAARAGAALPVFQTAAQAEHVNYTTRPGRRLLERAGCAARRRLPAEPLAAVPGFPGVAVVDAAGHTPGSQVVLAVLAGGRRLAFTGDVANHVEGVRRNLPKPALYGLVVAHDEAHLASLALPGFGALLASETR